MLFSYCVYVTRFLIGVDRSNHAGRTFSGGGPLARFPELPEILFIRLSFLSLILDESLQSHRARVWSATTEILRGRC